jgi:hypothetical protein
MKIEITGKGTSTTVMHRHPQIRSKIDVLKKSLTLIFFLENDMTCIIFFYYSGKSNCNKQAGRIGRHPQ